jgi:hypothetical protein
LAVEQTTRRGEFPEDRFETVTEQSMRWTIVVLVGLVCVLLPIRVWLASRIVTPWIMIDELIYADLARSVAEHLAFQFRDGPIEWFNFGYAALIAPAWLAADGQAGAFEIARTMNVLFGLLALVPTYVWARRLTGPVYALIAACLAALMPSLLYAGTLMSENAFLPAFLLATLAIGLALERPTLWRQAAVFAAIALASVIRVQGLVLVAVLITAVGLAAGLEARIAPPRDRLRATARYLAAFWPTAAALGGLVLAYLALKVAQGVPLSTGLGSYRIVAEADYRAMESARWVMRHTADIVLATGVFPFCALLVLLGLAVLRGAPSREERAFLATTASAVVWTVAQAALFASNFAQRIQERYMFCVFPLLFIALALWLFRGAPRRPWALSVAAAGFSAALVVLALPLRSLLGLQILSDTFALIPLLRLSQLLDGGVDTVETLLTVAVVAAALVFVVVPARLALLLPLALAGFLVLSSYSVYGAMRDYAATLAAGTTGPDHSWIDRTIGSDAHADYLYGGAEDPWVEATTLWQSELWNRKLDTVYNIGASGSAHVGEVHAALDPATGVVELPAGQGRPAPYAVVARRMGAVGKPVAVHGDLGLYRIDGPVRIGRRVEGVHADGWTGPSATLTQYAGSGPGLLHVRLGRTAWRGPDVPGRVNLRLGRLAVRDGRATLGQVLETRSWTAREGKARSFTLRTPQPPFMLELAVSPTFSPSEFGRSDTRQLGVQADFRLEPRAP